MVARSGSEWCACLPAGRVVRLDGSAYDEVIAALDPPPDDAPAVLSCHVGATDSASATAAGILDELEVAALMLFPAWLPGGDDLRGRSTLEVRAARALGKQLASSSRHFGPFVADLAEAAVRGRRLDPARYARETRAVGLARVLADSYRRSHITLVVTAAANLPVEDQQALAAACEWLAERGGMSVAVVAWAIPAIDRFSSVRLPEPTGDTTQTHPEAFEPILLTYPALAGRPHPGSDAEKKLESALSGCEWAHGRVWNMHYHSTPLHPPIRVDLIWPDAGCVVEVDGDDHRGRAKYAADRQRDVQLQLDGFAVLRFTNDQVLGDVSAVVSVVEQYVRGRRSDSRSTDTRSTTPVISDSGR